MARNKFTGLIALLGLSIGVNSHGQSIAQSHANGNGDVSPIIVVDPEGEIIRVYKRVDQIKDEVLKEKVNNILFNNSDVGSDSCSDNIWDPK